MSDPGPAEPRAAAAGGAVPGPDGLLRCPWALSAPDYLAYHDTEWGQPVTDVVGLFERMSLEGFQSGLSWITILRKRENFRRAFAGFEPAVVAEFTEADVDRLMADPGIVRNRRKVEAVVHNARVVAELGQGYADLVLSHGVTGRPRPTAAEWRATSPESVALAKALRRHDIRFVGPTTAYALLQAVGLVDDHLVDCWVSTGTSSAG